MRTTSDGCPADQNKVEAFSKIFFPLRDISYVDYVLQIKLENDNNKWLWKDLWENMSSTVYKL